MAHRDETELRRIADELTAAGGRSPSVAEVCAVSGRAEEAVLDALRASRRPRGGRAVARGGRARHGERLMR